jgi:hypothetical protein
MARNGSSKVSKLRICRRATVIFRAEFSGGKNEILFDISTLLYEGAAVNRQHKVGSSSHDVPEY